MWDDLTQRCSIFPVRPSQTRLYTPQPNTTSPAISAAARRCCAGLLAASMDSPPPLLASSPRSALPDHPQHGQATGSPPPALLTSAPCSLLPAEPLLHGQATGAPMEAQAPPPVPAAAAFCPPSYTAEWIFRDFACRRAALIRALTSGITSTLVVLPILAPHGSINRRSSSIGRSPQEC